MSRAGRLGQRQGLGLLWVLATAIIKDSAGYTRLAAVGDFGSDATSVAGEIREAQAAAVVTALDHEMRLHGVLALGDTNYPRGRAETIDQNVGKYYGRYMWPLTSNYSRGASDQVNRFFPCPGNHDWQGPTGLDPYLQYMPVGGRRYYDVKLGDIHIFSLDSDRKENKLDGTSPTSKQAMWLKDALAASTLPWKLVLSHSPPYSSGLHGGTERMRWPYEEWGATAVLSGHDHSYERVVAPGSGFPYFINGLGGGAMYDFGMHQGEPALGSAFKYTGTMGAQLIEADSTRITFKFIAAPSADSPFNHSGVDCYEIIRGPTGSIRYGPCSGAPFSATLGKTDDSIGSKPSSSEGTRNAGSGSSSKVLATSGTGGSSARRGSSSSSSSGKPEDCASEEEPCSESKPCCQPGLCYQGRCGVPRLPGWWEQPNRVQRPCRALRTSTSDMEFLQAKERAIGTIPRQRAVRSKARPCMASLRQDCCTLFHALLHLPSAAAAKVSNALLHRL